MSGVGPVEPGEGTHAWDTPARHTPPLSGPRHGRLARVYTGHRRAVLGAATAAALLAGGAYLYATRPQEPPPPPPPYPSQVVTLTYLAARSTPRDAPARSFRFDVLVSVASGPPVTVTRIDQPYAGVRMTSTPPAPFRTTAGSPRRITVTAQVTECGKVPGDAGLPFLDVTLRNARAIQVHSFILGPRYAQHLSKALEVACSNDSASSPKPRTHLNTPR
ncbi:Tat pathway signal sequence domain protein [Streptomyces sp. NPDC052682]|uniref:Tat pathway signal sequence domain protein n=1 Tax=Streptomyces sp. NPDC052682 TaxID=3154954 RepID=UPI00342A7526